MDNNNNNNESGRGFFRRSSDTESREMPESRERSERAPRHHERPDHSERAPRHHERSDHSERAPRSDERSDHSERAPRRDEGSDRPRHEQRPTSPSKMWSRGGDRPREDRPSSDKRVSGAKAFYGAKKSYGDKPAYGSNSGRPSSGDRPSYGRKPYGDKPAYGSHSGRSSSGDRPSYGKKPYGDKPAYGAKPQYEKEKEEKIPDNLIFGIHPVREAIEAGTEIEKIYFRHSGSSDLSDVEYSYVSTLDALRDQATESDIHIQNVPVEKLNRLSRNGNHQGVIAVISAITYKEINELTEELSAQIEAGEKPLVMLLDSVTDIRNFGAIARSAECAGVAALIMPAKNSAPVNAEAIKSSAGALTIIPVSRVGSLRGAISLLKGIGMQCVATTEKSSSLIFETDLTKATVLIMGAEDKGISREILSMCDVQAGIPLVGRIESLNVSAAAAVVLFEARRQRFEKE